MFLHAGGLYGGISAIKSRVLPLIGSKGLDTEQYSSTVSLHGSSKFKSSEQVDDKQDSDMGSQQHVETDRGANHSNKPGRKHE